MPISPATPSVTTKLIRKYSPSTNGISFRYIQNAAQYTFKYEGETIKVNEHNTGRIWATGGRNGVAGRKFNDFILNELQSSKVSHTGLSSVPSAVDCINQPKPSTPPGDKKDAIEVNSTGSILTSIIGSGGSGISSLREEETLMD